MRPRAEGGRGGRRIDYRGFYAWGARAPGQYGVAVCLRPATCAEGEWHAAPRAVHNTTQDSRAVCAWCVRSRVCRGAPPTRARSAVPWQRSCAPPHQHTRRQGHAARHKTPHDGPACPATPLAMLTRASPRMQLSPPHDWLRSRHRYLPSALEPLALEHFPTAFGTEASQEAVSALAAQNLR
eukprot:537989-Prymnesium_polylepis.2